MVPFLLELNASAKATVNRILNGANDGLRFLFERLESVPSPSAPPAPPAYAVSQNILGRRDDSFRMNPAEPPRVEIDGFFGEDGLIARKFPKFEARKPQQEMAAAVAKALNQDCLLVAEAGTGVGKSLAYLIPVVLRALQAPDEKSVISTHTKTLQDQLFFKDLPLVRQVVDKPFLAVLLKGRNNYICLERFRALLDHLEEKLDRSERRCLLPLTLWIHETRTGDIDDTPCRQDRQPRGRQPRAALRLDRAKPFGAGCIRHARGRRGAPDREGGIAIPGRRVGGERGP
jgi:hypothetical protein